MENKFTAPLQIIAVAPNDYIQFSVADDTPFAPVLYVYDIDDAEVYGPVSYSYDGADRYYFHVRASSAFGMGTQSTYYKVKAEDRVNPGYTESTWIVYVSQGLDYESYIKRALGLAGANIRMYSHTWTRGLLTEYHIRIYETAAKLTTAEAGGTDDYYAHYKVTITYDSNYNPVSMQSVKQ